MCTLLTQQPKPLKLLRELLASGVEYSFCVLEIPDPLSQFKRSKISTFCRIESADAAQSSRFQLNFAKSTGIDVNWINLEKQKKHWRSFFVNL